MSAPNFTRRMLVRTAKEADAEGVLLLRLDEQTRYMMYAARALTLARAQKAASTARLIASRSLTQRLSPHGSRLRSP